jgi:BAAT / Acyl-CoA thioester hydrolase C terminal
MRDLDAVERATIPVERIKGPVLMVSGRDDQLWTSFQLAETARRRLEGHNHPWPFEHISYPDAGHGTTPPYASTTATTSVHPVNRRTYALGGRKARSKPTWRIGGERSIFLRKRKRASFEQ